MRTNVIPDRIRRFSVITILAWSLMIPVSSFPSADTITLASQLFVSFCFLRLSSPVRLCRAIMSISYPILSHFRMQKIIRDSTENNGLFTHPILSQNATKHGKSVAYPAQYQRVPN